ncbi:hypothetical protein MC885_007452, partial [Smutsia gigantea]
ERAVKKTGHRLITTKQKRNRKRNKKQNSYSKTMEEASFETLSCSLPGDQEPSLREEEGLELTRRESRRAFTESLLPGDCVVPLIWKMLTMIYLQWKTSVELDSHINQ